MLGDGGMWTDIVYVLFTIPLPERTHFLSNTCIRSSGTSA